MTVSRDDDVVRLEGNCALEEAETLVALLQQGGVRAVDLSACRHLHGALVQALVTFGVPLTGTVEDPFLRDIVVPAMKAAARDKSAASG